MSFVVQTRCSFKKFDGTCDRSGEMLTMTITDDGATRLRETSVSLMRAIVSATSVPRSETSGTTPQTSASCRAMPALLVAGPQIYSWAWLILALGIAMRLVPWLERAASRWRRCVIGSFPVERFFRKNGITLPRLPTTFP